MRPGSTTPALVRPLLLQAGLLVVVALAGAPSFLSAQEGACATPEHRAFDFWVGSWEVRNAAGQKVGDNEITRKLGGCVLHERYSTPRGYQGESLNIYDASRGVWHQTWTDNGGLLLRLEGGIQEGRMVMEGTTVRPDGVEARQRITWSMVDGDSDRVRQHWESSTDGGSTWSTAFDGLYVRRGSQAGSP